MTDLEKETLQQIVDVFKVDDKKHQKLLDSAKESGCDDLLGVYAYTSGYYEQSLKSVIMHLETFIKNH